ncbi:MAG: hypothetical protein WBM71_09080 [Sedimenticolaceae bacterium]
MAVFNKPAAMRPSGFLGLSLLAVALTIGVAVVLWQAVELSSVSRVSAQIDRIRPFASGVRLALIGLVAVLWPRLVQITHRYGRVDEARRGDILAQRWRVVGWLLVIELVLGQDLFGRFFAVTTGPVV